MIVIERILDEAALADAMAGLALVRWEDGQRTAGAAARGVKQNEQADLSSRSGARLKETLLSAVLTHPVVEAWARPKRVSEPLISRTSPGGGYGLHIDNPLMGSGKTRLRTDISFTLFLSPPDVYEGGALEIETATRTESVKGPAGSLVLYPSTELHRVAPVTGGQRIVFVGWIESLIRGAGERAILFDLANLKAGLARTFPPGSPEMLSLAKTEANLIRLWAS